MSKNRIQIFTGAYGSGKTEVSMNHAVKLRQGHDQVALVDLDIVNPYFRSREAAGPLTEAGVNVVFPEGELATSDLPAISPRIKEFIQNPDYQVVLDVGGDDVGAIALGRFNPYLKDYDMNFVINTLRPFTKDFVGIHQIMQEVMNTARLPITHLIANINLCEDTTVEDIKNGYPVIKEVSERLELPIKYIAVLETLKDQIDPSEFEVPIEFIRLYNRPEWLRR